MGELNFNRRQCLRAFKKLGFYIGGKRRGIHDKYYPPKEIAESLASNQAHFIMIPRHNELHVQAEIVKELKAMGSDKLVEKFKKYL
jgi:flagellar biosynthesis protein FliP